MDRLVSFFGIILLLAIAFALSSNRKAISKPVVFWGLGLQLALAVLVFGIPFLDFESPLRSYFVYVNDAIVGFLNYTALGSQFIFGDLGNNSKGFYFAFQILPTIIFFSSFMAVLYHLKIMYYVVLGLAWVMKRLMKISGAESLAVAANVFVGQTEAPLVIKPYIERMTRSELYSLMTGGMATVAGGVLASYVLLLKDSVDQIAAHLLTASLMSAPAALAIAKIMLPETGMPETMGSIPKESKKSDYTNVIDAAASGAGEGLKLALNVGAMLLAFIALVALMNGMLTQVGEWISFNTWGVALVPDVLLVNGEAQLTWQLVLGWLFSPLAFFMGIPWEECMVAGALLGEKVILNEYVAYLHLSQVTETLSTRTELILSYALCGFANFSSIAIQIGGIGGISPSRKKDLAELGIKSVIGGSLAAFLTATIAGLLM